jgi:hypothetical protein
VLAPTRELTAQIKAEAVKLLSPHGNSLGVQVSHLWASLSVLFCFGGGGVSRAACCEAAFCQAAEILRQNIGSAARFVCIGRVKGGGDDLHVDMFLPQPQWRCPSKEGTHSVGVVVEFERAPPPSTVR